MKHLSWILSFLLLAASLALSVQVVANARKNQEHKSDYAELNSIKYGIFSIDAWKGRLTTIVTKELDEFSISEETESELREHVAIVLRKMVDEAAKKIKQANGKTIGGKVKQSLIDFLVDIDDVKKGVPAYTEAVMQELQKPKTKRQMKTLLNDQVEEFAASTADEQDKSLLKAILAKLHAKDLDAARAKLEESITPTHRLIAIQSTLLIALGIVHFLLLAFGGSLVLPQFLFFVLSLLSLLVVGVATPMIDMEAKIAELKFMLIGHPILFENQILYFQSKSITDVFLLMVTDDQIQMKLVAILIVAFSVIFPVLKLLSAVAYYFDLKAARNRTIIKFFVHKSAKWSMADVMVVAIFMAYIGFNGVISSQLRDLSFPESGVTVIATNGTALQPGYYVFVTFVVLSMLLSVQLEKFKAGGRYSAVDRE